LNLPSLRRIRLRLLAPSIAVIVATTMIPVGLRYPSLRHIEYTFDPFDFVNNILLYMPLGLALSGTSLARAFLWGLSLSTVAETLQLGYIDRIPSPLDITSNTLGAMCGYLVALWMVRRTGRNPKSLRVPRWVSVVAILFGLAGTISLVRHSLPSDFSNWDPSYHLAVGNELTGERPWEGTVSRFAVYPVAMTELQISGIARTLRLPPGGLLPPADFAQKPGRSLLSPQDEIEWDHTLVHRSQLTLLVWMQTSNLEQVGPARIVTYSQDPSNRNFTLGQVRDTLTFRLRTPASGLNGTSPALYTGPVLSKDRPTFVAAVYDGRNSSLYVDGKRVGRVDVGARRPHLSRHIMSWIPIPIPVREVELGAAEMLYSGLFALGIFGLGGVPPHRSMRLLLGVLAGVVIGGITWVFGISEPGLGIRILVECVAAGLVIAVSVENQDAAIHKYP
jgi:VanZ like family/Concanavalin A-like lectin/glucanases superfamily